MSLLISGALWKAEGGDLPEALGLLGARGWRGLQKGPGEARGLRQEVQERVETAGGAARLA